jgi:alpha-L-fucosidase 2
VIVGGQKTFSQDYAMNIFAKYTAVCVILFGCIELSMAQTTAPRELDRCNVVWTTPSQNASGSMPIGNGEVGLNVWVEENGDLVFYISRTDAWSECSRLLKLGRIRVSLSPNPFAKGQPFRQELDLRNGQIVITAADATLRVFVDSDSPIIYVTGEGTTPRTISAKLENWRTKSTC